MLSWRLGFYPNNLGQKLSSVDRFLGNQEHLFFGSQVCPAQRRFTVVFSYKSTSEIIQCPMSRYDSHEVLKITSGWITTRGKHCPTYIHIRPDLWVKFDLRISRVKVVVV